MKKKRITLSIFLIIFLFSVFSVPTKAATVAKIGNTKYTSLKKAIAHVKKGQTITLKKNVTISKVLRINKPGKSFTLNLNHKTITLKGNGCFKIKAGKVTIKNGSILNKKARGTILKVMKDGKVMIQGGTYKGSLVNSGVMRIQSGTFTTAFITNNGKLTIGGASFNSTVNLNLYNYGILNMSDEILGSNVTIIG